MKYKDDASEGKEHPPGAGMRGYGPLDVGLSDPADCILLAWESILKLYIK